MNSEISVTPTVAIIIPAYNAEATLPACLEGIANMSRPADEVIMFSDGATDRTDEIARVAGVTIIRNDGPPRGPGYGRNAAAATAKSQYLLFVDADVVISRNALALLLDDMLKHGASAAFGSYDDAPRSQRVTSLYANLRHHFVHQNSARDATTFWSGLGLIDRQLFMDLGGYDVALYAHPSIEDVELGTRAIAAGHRIRLVPEALSKHCKDWSLWRVWHTDVVRRAYPWSCLLADGATNGADLNVQSAERAKAAIALLVALFLVLGLFKPALLIGAAAMALFYIYMNRKFFSFLARTLAPWMVPGAMAMHWCYHIYSSATFVFVMLQTRLGLRKPHIAKA
jgi:glycosyltransferase involved in cell wall biosynthesis